MASRLRVMIVDDEPLAQRRLARLLKPLADVEVVAVADSGRHALDLFAATQPNTILLDVEMPGLNGFDLIERLPADAAPAVIFVTAFDGYAFKAFRARAADYVLKPVEPAQLADALTAARRDLDARRVDAKLAELQDLTAALRRQVEEADPRYDRELWVDDRAKRVRVPVGDIVWIEAERDYVRLHAGARSFLVHTPLSSVAGRLDPGEFVRVHRSAVVRIGRVRSVHRRRYGVLEVELDDGTLVRVGRTYATAVRERIATGF